VAVLGGVGWLVFGHRGSPSAAPPVTTTVSAPPSATTTPPVPTASTASMAAPTTSRSVLPALPGTDAQGFLDYPGARCDPGSSPAALARTTASVLVVCRSGPGQFYYRGVRLSDGAGIELANAVRSSGGFDVTNPTDGTRYQIRPDTLSIIGPDGQAVTEQMVQYATG
jgi:hypothetical protein